MIAHVRAKVERAGPLLLTEQRTSLSTSINTRKSRHARLR